MTMEPVIDLAESEAIASALAPLSAEGLVASRRLVVVVDGHAAPLWADMIADLMRRLRSTVGDVTHLILDTDNPGSAEVTPSPGPGATDGDADLPASGTAGVVVVLTDGAAVAWHTGAAGARIRSWAQRHTVALVHLLPQLLWHRTGVSVQRARFRAPGVASPNVELEWESTEPVGGPGSEGSSAPEDVPVPVLRPSWLSNWVDLVTGATTDWVCLPAMLAGPWQAPPEPETPELVEFPIDARDQVRRFTSWATPTAVSLATKLAAAPLNLPMIRKVQRELLPASGAAHLSEIVNSGLLHQVVTSEPMLDERRVTFEFGQGVRAELLAAARRSDTRRVLRLVAEHLGEAVPAVAGLRQVLDDPEHAPERTVTRDTEPFVRAEQAALQALSGPYLARSRRLSAQLSADPLPAGTAAADGGVDERPPLSESSPPPIGPRIPGGPGVTSQIAPVDAATSVVPASTQRFPAIWGKVPPRNVNFTGRTELLARLQAQMRSGTTAVLPQALRGMGGVGKSQLAVEYVYRHQGQYDVVWWIPAERATQAKTALVELGQRMGLAVSRQVNAALPVVLEALRVGDPYANWLLVFDNAESPEALRECLPVSGPGTILITSRDSRWSSVAATLEVDVFRRDESVALLRRRRPELGDEVADQLAEALGDLPLAIEQAGAWLAETGMPAEEYLRLFREKRAELMEVSVPTDYQLPVAAAWNVSLDRLARRPAALRLLQVCSFLASEPIPRTLLGRAHNVDIHPDLNATIADPMRLNRAIRDINRYALAKISYTDNSLHMHRLIQAVLIDQLSESEQARTRHSAHMLLTSSDPNDPSNPTYWPTYMELYPHVIASLALESTNDQVQRLVENEARFLYWWGDHEAARGLAKRAYRFRTEHVGPDAASTLSIGRWLAFMYFVTGRYADAAALNQELLAAHERVAAADAAESGLPGPVDTDELLDAIGAIAADQRVAGDFATALVTAQDVYDRYVRALGDDDPETLNAAHNLGVSLRLVGDFQRAAEIDEDTEARRRLLLGDDHMTTLVSTQHRIIDRRELGDYLFAQSMQQTVVDRLLRLLDPQHPQVLLAMRHLSVAMRKAGNHVDARDLSDDVRRALVRRYDESHPDTILATLNLAIDMRATGQLDEADQLCEQAEQGYTRLLGARHPHTLAASLNRAVVQRLRGDAAAARARNEAGIEALRASVGERHPLTLAGSVNLASDLYALGDYAAAYELDVQTRQRLLELWGDQHPTTLACSGNLVMDLLALDRRGEAEELHRRTLESFHRSLGREHPATAAAADVTVRGNCDLDPMPL